MVQTGYLFSKKHVDLQNYYYFDSGFSSEELDKIYNDVAEIDFVQATTIGGDNKEARSSSIKWIPQNMKWNWLYGKLMDMAVEANKALWDFDLYSAPEQIQYTEYYASEGGHYIWHQDIGPGMLSLRKVSITVQLSDSNEYEGGDLDIWQGGKGHITVPRGKGTVVIFPSYMMHRVSPVTVGTRRSFVLWLGGEHYR
jgi:PKHD-type hydroxylase